MNEDLVAEAEALGINASLYYLLRPDLREDALKKDIARVRHQMREQRKEMPDSR